MNTRCGMKKKKNTTRWLAILIIVALTISSIVLPGSGVSARADNLDDKTVSVENLDEESTNNENLTSDTDDKENLNNNITDNNNLDSKITDDENKNTRTVDNENLNNNTSDNSNSESNNANNNQNINTINNEKLDSNSGNNNQNIGTISNENINSEIVDNENLKDNSTNTENLDNGSGYTTEGSEGSNDTFPVATLSDDGIQLYATKEIDAEYFYEIEMEMNAASTNEHYIAKGIYVDANGDAHIVLGFQKNSNYKDILKVKVGEKEIIDPNYEVIKADNPNDSLVINLPNNEIKTLENNLGLMIIDIGKIENLTEKFNFAIDTPTGGEYGTAWDLGNVAIKVYIEYSIEKNVVKDGVIVNNPEVKIGDEITYQVTIKNDSEVPLNEIKVTDKVPDGLVVTKIDGKETTDSNKTGTITIAENVTLAKKGAEGSSITYTITAIVSDNAVPGKITNTAIMENKYIVPDEDSADVTVIRAASIVKIVAGNMGDTTKAFTFNITVGEEDFGTFDLAHNGVKDISNIPSNGTLKLSELNSDGYEVKVDVNGVEQTVVDGVCTIELGSYGAKDLNIVVTNTKNVLIDTGILLDSLPYITILAVVIIGGGVFFINKRKKENDI